MKFIPELYKTEQTAVKIFFDKNTIYCTFTTKWDIIWCFCVLTNRGYSDTMNLQRLPGRAWQTKRLRYAYAGETYEQQKMGALDMFQVVKRDGELDEFKIGKITAAIHKAFDAKEKNYSEEMIDLLGLRVTSDFQKKITDNKITVEEIQDSVENVLIQAGYADVAKAYILYRKQREKVRNMKSTILDYKEIVNSYVKVEDWRVKENSTVTYSVGGLILSNSGAVTANYWLSEIYDNEIADAHRNADIHIHDLSMLTGYCAGWSLKQLIQEGLGGIEGKITSSPAKHLSVLCNQMVNFLGIMQNEWAGAQAFSSFDTYLAPFVKAELSGSEEVY